MGLFLAVAIPAIAIALGATAWLLVRDYQRERAANDAKTTANLNREWFVYLDKLYLEDIEGTL
jgi:hypothetical protein